ncbi:MAG: FlgD immunoglobulin-like domain containing protein [Candidatus Krumholzibacteriaceae bacterium]
MRNMIGVMIAIGLVVAFTGPARGRERGDHKKIHVKQQWSPEQYAGLDNPAAPGGYHTSATVDTYTVVSYDFETMNWQGWTRRDNTAQRGTFFHVDDFAGLGGGRYGRLVAIQGTKSMWCGVRPSAGDPYVCSWLKAPGYGNGWDQSLATAQFSFTGPITLSYHLVYDSEPGYDFTRVEYDGDFWGSSWQTLATYTGHGDTVASHVVYSTHRATKLRFHFTSDGAWSDEDGLWDTDGGCIVDEIHVSDSGTLNNYQDFESAQVGATSSGIWVGMTPTPYGMYSGLKNNLWDEDPCGQNLASQIVFFVGSPNPCGECMYTTTPFCMGPGGMSPPCQDEMVLSPLIDITKYSTGGGSVQNAAIPPGELPQLGGMTFAYTVYRDLPLANLVFYTVEIEDIGDSGCPANMNFVDWLWYYGQEKEYLRVKEDISGYAGRKYIQVAFRVADMCSVWYLIRGNCAAHTAAPYFDNVKVQRYRSVGPQWAYYDEDLFQDNFPPDDALAGFVRADAAVDINPSDNPVIRPGDSVVVRCSSPVGGGIASDAGGPRVYMHVRCTSIGYPVKPSLAGPQLQGTYGHYVSDDGTWTIIQCDTARTGHDIYTDRFMADLNDSLFTRGYMIEYYFKAYDNAGESSTLPRGADHFTADNPYFGSSYYFEFTCLPTGMAEGLYVDDYDGIGSFDGIVQDYFDRTFKDVAGPPSVIDRYDVLAPTSMVSNGLASRVRASQLDSAYLAIIWDSGDLSRGTITDGTAASGGKTNDCQLLVDFLNLAPYKYYYPAGLWILGDNVAEDLSSLSSPQALALMNTWCGVSLTSGSYFETTGGQRNGGAVNPLITGVSEYFVPGGIPYKFYVFGGCPGINSFDVLGATGGAQWALKYPDYSGQQYCAAVQSQKTLPNGRLIRTMWFGFSFMSMRDCSLEAPIIRNQIAHSVLRNYLGAIGGAINITSTGTPRAYRLAQNFPNPFNPSTTIQYDMKEKGLVTLKIYNVAGALVRTLVDEVKNAGTYSLAWDGRNNAGTAVASGIYFYKMETKGFSATKKMVILR